MWIFCAFSVHTSSSNVLLLVIINYFYYLFKTFSIFSIFIHLQRLFHRYGGGDPLAVRASCCIFLISTCHCFPRYSLFLHFKHSLYFKLVITFASVFNLTPYSAMHYHFSTWFCLQVLNFTTGVSPALAWSESFCLSLMFCCFFLSFFSIFVWCVMVGLNLSAPNLL